MRKWSPLIAVCLGTFMLLVDVTIVNVALPAMSDDLDTSFADLQWVVDVYALTMGALLLGAGGLADRIGRRRVYVWGLAIFAVSSLVCGLAPGAEVLIAARAVQGLGAAAMFATTVALLNVNYVGKDRGVAFGVWGAVAGGSAAAGPIMGGLLTDHLDWRWIFFVNLPISVIAVVMSLRTFPVDERRADAPRLDLAGVVTFTAFAAALIYALIKAGEDGWGQPVVVVLLVASGLSLIGFVLVEGRVADPLIDLQLFRNPTFSGVMVASLLINAAAFSYLLYTSVWLQTVEGQDAVQTGLTGSMPLSVAAFLVSGLIGTRYLHDTNPRWIISGGMTLIGVGALAQAFVDTGSTWKVLFVGLVVCGIGVGFAMPTLASTAMASVPPEKGGMAAGAVNTMRQIGFALGIVLLGVVFKHRAADVLEDAGVADPHDTASRLASGEAPAFVNSAGPEQRGSLDDLVHHAFASGLNGAFVVAGALGLLGGLVTALTLGRDRDASHPVAATAAPN